MKTARFANVVAKSGKPEIYLTLMEPAKDRTLQAAVKANRVMTVMQEHAGSKADHGVASFEVGKNRQYLVFPKSLRAFAGRAIVGIKYDLLDVGKISKKDQAAPPHPPKRKLKRTRPRRENAEEAAGRKLLPFRPEPKEEDSDEVTDLKKQIRHAMALLEDGKAVAAFNLLKRAVGE